MTRYVKPICGFCYEGSMDIVPATHQATRPESATVFDVCEKCAELFRENGTYYVTPLNLNEDGILEQGGVI